MEWLMRELKRDLWPHRVTLHQIETDVSMYTVEKWVGERLGIFKDQWNMVYQHNRTDFYFKQASDATLFSLKWS
jgi:hypothetical protein